MGRLPKLSDHNNHHEEPHEIQLWPASREPFQLKDTDYRIVREGSRKAVAVGILVVVAVLASMLVAGITIEEVAHVTTDPLERVGRSFMEPCSASRRPVR